MTKRKENKHKTKIKLNIQTMQFKIKQHLDENELRGNANMCC